MIVDDGALHDLNLGSVADIIKLRIFEPENRERRNIRGLQFSRHRQTAKAIPAWIP